MPAGPAQDRSDRWPCECCGACCRHPGEVRLENGEPEALAACLGLTVHEFTRPYARLREDRRGLVLTVAADGACVFLRSDNHCQVQAAKPRQCRRFPHDWRYADLARVCPVARRQAERST